MDPKDGLGRLWPFGYLLLAEVLEGPMIMQGHHARQAADSAGRFEQPGAGARTITTPPANFLAEYPVPYPLAL